MYGDGRNKTHTLRRGGLRFDFSAVAKDPCEVQDDFGYKASLQCDTFARRYRDILGDGLADRILSAEEAPSVVNVNLAGRTDLNAIRKSESPYVVTWNAAPANVDFVLDAQSHADGYRISPDEKGLLLKRFLGITILIR